MPLVFAYGFSFLDEEYDVVQSSQLESYDAGPHAQSDPYGFCSREVFAAGTMIVDPDDATMMIDSGGTPDYAVRTVLDNAGGGIFASSIGGVPPISIIIVAASPGMSAGDSAKVKSTTGSSIRSTRPMDQIRRRTSYPAISSTQKRNSRSISLTSSIWVGLRRSY